jgi:3-hydroxy-9,10-secoandrosta-1,3,5(10)-triene-9,17-dione monooxygenase reductase component
MTAEIIDDRHFRAVLGHFSTGVVIITADENGPVGMTAQSVVSLSLHPPLVLFCPAKTSTSWPHIRDAGSFCVNILADDQEALCAGFARSGGDKFQGVEWRPGVTGAPVINGVLAHIECNIATVYPGGDHDIVIGRVIALDIQRDAPPMLFFRGDILRY